MLTSQIHPLDGALQESGNTISTRRTIFEGATPGVRSWSCHASVLMPNHSALPPHHHDEEEILLVLDGEVQLQLVDAGWSPHDPRLRLRRGNFIFCPPRVEHSLRAVSTTLARYLVLKWQDAVASSPSAMGFGRFDAFASEPENQVGRDGWTRQRLFAAPTANLHQLRCHVSTIQPGAGYAPHSDPYDVAIVTLQGDVETLGERVPRDSLIFYTAGDLHGLRNPGEVPAIYLVFEFHSRRMATSTAPAPSLLVKLMEPQRWKRKMTHLLDRFRR